MPLSDGKFTCCRLTGGNFDVEAEHIDVRLGTGVHIYLSARNCYPSGRQVEHWIALARENPGTPVECFHWQGEEPNRRPVAACRIVYTYRSKV